MIEFEENAQNGPVIKVIGVGGGGGNAINNMIEKGIADVEFMAANTDCQALEINQAMIKLQLGHGSTKGLGAGAKPEVGSGAAKESIDRIEELLAGADMVFVAAGMGGGTGTGAAPIIADVARRQGALTVGVVTKPFAFEGNRRRKQAERGIEALKEAVDTLIIVPNDRLLELANAQTSVLDAFKMADQVLFNAVKGISDMITQQGVINVDFADAVSVMRDQGMALMGIGRGTGDKRAMDAAHQAISSPLLEDVSVEGATGILVNVTGGPSLTLHEVNSAIALITDVAHEDANVIFGYVVDERMGDDVAITVIATGFDRASNERQDLGGISTSRPSMMPVAAQHRADPDVPTYIRRGWHEQSSLPAMAASGGTSRTPSVARQVSGSRPAPSAPARAEASVPPAMASVPVAQPSAAPSVLSTMPAPSADLSDVRAHATMPASAPSAVSDERTGRTATPRGGTPMISMLPPVEEENPRRAAARETGGFNDVLAEDEYDIPAFLRRNAE